MEIKIYEVGGCVRDEIMGIVPNDIDYSVEAPSFEAMHEYIKSISDKIFLVTPEFFTIRALVGRDTFDYVLCRKDGQYKDGRHPESVSVGTLYDDLARRDFTMNAIAKDSEGNYIDPFEGFYDIKYGIIRCVGNTYERITEDYIRLLRAIRFSITKGFSINHEIEDMFYSEDIVNAMINSVSQERIYSEIMKMAKYSTPMMIEKFAKYPMFTSAIFSGNVWMKPTMEKR